MNDKSLEEAAEETCRAIGKFAFEFSQMEYTIRHHLALEIGLAEQFFSPIIESYDVGLLCTVAIEVYSKTRLPEAAKRIKTLIDRFNSFAAKRNRFAHGLWVPFKDGGTLHYVNRNKLKPETATDQAAELIQLADELSQLRHQFETGLYDIG